MSVCRVGHILTVTHQRPAYVLALLSEEHYSSIVQSGKLSVLCLCVCVSRGAYTQAESPVTVLMRRGPAVASLPALGPWATPAERGPSLESIYRGSLTVDLCEG